MEEGAGRLAACWCWAVNGLLEMKGTTEDFPYPADLVEAISETIESTVSVTKWKNISDPSTLFSGWSFVIKAAHWPAFGVLLKDRWKDKVKCKLYAVSTPTEWAFEEGDTFTRRSGDGVIQVVDNGYPLEVKYIHDGKSLGYHLNEGQLSSWLKSGVKPAEKYRIDRNQSRSEIARFHEYSE